MLILPVTRSTRVSYELNPQFTLILLIIEYKSFKIFNMVISSIATFYRISAKKSIIKRSYSSFLIIDTPCF